MIEFGIRVIESALVPFVKIVQQFFGDRGAEVSSLQAAPKQFTLVGAPFADYLIRELYKNTGINLRGF